LNMSTVFAQMNGDSIGAAKFGLLGGEHGTWLHALAGLAQRANMININA